MTTVAYCAVAEEGRTFRHQLTLRPASCEQLKRLTEAVHEGGAKASLQLSHAGFFSKMRGPDGKWPRGPSWNLNHYGSSAGMPLSPPMDQGDLDRVVEAFGEAAAKAASLGFDAVELHFGHGYLLSQFLSPATNRREDAYGGSTEARLRLPLEVAERVREAVGPGLAVLAKSNLSDGFEGGLRIEEAVEIAKGIEAAGTIDALVLSGGFTSRSAFYLLRGGRPLREMAGAQEGLLERAAMRAFGRWLVKPYPFEELFFLPQARKVREAVGMPLGLLGGVASLDNMRAARAEGFELIVMGRALIADPDLVRRMEQGEAERTRCDRCNLCIAEMDKGGVRCVLDDRS
jgi:2,4-dienoyl-CoA reductase-like NADH-dependent reductase (Old Yellow Enzyme family)